MKHGDRVKLASEDEDDPPEPGTIVNVYRAGLCMMAAVDMDSGGTDYYDVAELVMLKTE